MDPDSCRIAQKLTTDHSRLARSTSAVDRMGIMDDLNRKKRIGSFLNIPSLIVNSEKNSRNNLSPFHQIQPGSEPGSRITSANFYRKRVTDAVVEIPTKQLKRLREQDLGSYTRETKHFCETTTMHGPKRVYKGKKWSFIFWALMFIASVVFLCVQVYTLTIMYFNKPTVSQVSFEINDKGLDFPVITICPFNPVKKSKIRALNATGDFSPELFGYLLDTNVEAPALYSSSNREEFEEGERLLDDYKKKHPEFNLYTFFKNNGFTCTDLLRWCTFGGRKFQCCSVVTSVLTTIGQCQRIDLRSSGLAWMEKQTAAGVNAGLQLILDSQQDEQFDDMESTVASPQFERGFRYYIHDNMTVPYLASEGMSVSPGMRVYSALSINKYFLLDQNNWGLCINKWPENYNVSLDYSAATCSAKCKAMYFMKKCNCSPSAYDIEDIYPVCSPLQVVNCIHDNLRVLNDSHSDFHMPICTECQIECKSTIYQTFNSYGKEFSAPSMRWLAKKNASWTPDVIKKNFLTVNVFFRDLTHTEYNQVKATTVTELLSNIGGNMGMFLGMSTITITEITLFLCKMFWIAFSRRRRNYMAEKKKREEDQDKEVVETVKEFKRIRSCTDLHSISTIRPEPYSIQDFYMQPSPPQLSIDSYNSSLGEVEKDVDSGNVTDR